MSSDFFNEFMNTISGFKMETQFDIINKYTSGVIDKEEFLKRMKDAEQRNTSSLH